MKTIAILTATSHTKTRCSTSRRGADDVDEGKSSAVAAYAMDTLNSRNLHATPERCSGPFHFWHDPSRIPPVACTIGVVTLRRQRQRRPEENEEIEQHGPVLNVVEVEFHALLDLFLIVDLAAPAIDL